jgi:hypothetical protein
MFRVEHDRHDEDDDVSVPGRLGSIEGRPQAWGQGAFPAKLPAGMMERSRSRPVDPLGKQTMPDQVKPDDHKRRKFIGNTGQVDHLEAEHARQILDRNRRSQGGRGGVSRLPAWCAGFGHEYLGSFRDGGQWRLYVRKTTVD